MLVSRPLNGAGQPFRVTAVCDLTDAIGDLVHIKGSRIGSDYTVEKVDVTKASAKPSIGIIVAKLAEDRCVVQFEGEVKGIYLDLLPGKHYFAGANARPSQSPPNPAAGGKTYLQLVGVALAEDTLYLKPEPGMKVKKG